MARASRRRFFFLLISFRCFVPLSQAAWQCQNHSRQNYKTPGTFVCMATHMDAKHCQTKKQAKRKGKGSSARDKNSAGRMRIKKSQKPRRRVLPSIEAPPRFVLGVTTLFGGCCGPALPCLGYVHTETYVLCVGGARAIMTRLLDQWFGVWPGLPLKDTRPRIVVDLMFSPP